VAGCYERRWAEKRNESAAQDKPAHLLFDLRAMEYLHLLKQNKRKEALEYARTHFPAHAHTHMSGKTSSVSAHRT
jgi:hypothetical protein